MNRSARTLAAMALATLTTIEVGAQSPRATPVDVVVVARVEAVEPTPACGVLFSSPVARHTVLHVERGALPPGPLYAFYMCGWTGGTTPLSPGAVLRLSLTRRPRHAFGNTVDRMGDPTSPRFYVERAEPAVAPDAGSP